MFISKRVHNKISSFFYISERIEANYRLDGRKFNSTQLKEHKSKVIFKGCLYTVK